MLDLIRAVQTNAAERERCFEKIVAQLRSLIPVLEDHNLTNTAKPCKELVFEWDVLEARRVELCRSLDPEAMLRFILDKES